MDLSASARQAALCKDYAQLDDLWTELMLNEDTLLNDYFEIARVLKKQNDTEHAYMLLEMLAQNFETNQCYDEAIKTYRELIRYTKTDNLTRQKLIQLYRIQYKNSSHLEQYLELSSLVTGNSILKSLEKLNEFLAFDIGTLFYFERYGTGEVIEVKPEQEEIVVDFELKKRHFLTLSVARGLLTPVLTGHFLYYKHKNPAVLERLSAEEPVELLVLILKSFSQPLSAAHVKKHLEGIIDKNSITAFWEKHRTQLEKNSSISVSGRSVKSYEYVGQHTDRSSIAMERFSSSSDVQKFILALEYASTMPETFKSIMPKLVSLGNALLRKKPALALDILLLGIDHDLTEGFTYDLDTFAEHKDAAALVTKLKSARHQQIFLDHLMTARPAHYPHMFQKLMYSAQDPRLFDAIASRLDDMPDIVHDIYRTVFSLPKSYPHQYGWMLKKIQDGSLPEFFAPAFMVRILDSLNYIKGIKATVYKICGLERFDTLISQAPEQEASRILQAIRSNAIIEEYKKQELENIVAYHFPQLCAQVADVVYATEKSLSAKEAELNHLLVVDIPQNKKELSRAREFGDLSENFEYKAAKEKQAQLMEKARLIEQALKKVKLIKAENIDASAVSIGTRVTLRSTDKGDTIEYTILGRWDTDLNKHILSNEAPVAQTLLGRKQGETVSLNDSVFEIVEIARAL
jgi:transcription elongation factor GreA